jgi:hypothetical protein
MRQLSYKFKGNERGGISAGFGLGGEEELKAGGQRIGGSGLAFPDDQHAPAQTLQRVDGGGVPHAVAADLRSPVVGVGLRLTRPASAVMTVPEAPMHENDGAAGAEDDVRLSGKVFRMKTEAIAKAVEERTDKAFGRRVLGAHAGHDCGAIKLLRRPVPRLPSQQCAHPQGLGSVAPQAISAAAPARRERAVNLPEPCALR